MGLMRSVLLAGSENVWLRRRAPHLPFVKTAVTRFMPGERLEDALEAAAALHRQGIGVVLTELGENVTDAAQADHVTRHYQDALATVAARGLDGHISIKLTQLGLDVDRERCHANVRALAADAKNRNNFVWIDMEQHRYVDATLELYRRVLRESRMSASVFRHTSIARRTTSLTHSARRRHTPGERRVSRAARCRDAEEA